VVLSSKSEALRDSEKLCFSRISQTLFESAGAEKNCGAMKIAIITLIAARFYKERDGKD